MSEYESAERGRREVRMRWVVSARAAVGRPTAIFQLVVGQRTLAESDRFVVGLEHQVHHQHHDRQKEYGHDAAGSHEIRDPITCRSHDQGIHLMGGNEK